MKTSNVQLINYVLVVIVTAAVGFGVHVLVRYLASQPLWQFNIVGAYVTNVILAVLILIAAGKAPARFTTSLGFLFLAGSAIKFAVFFIGFMPAYKADDVLTRDEFFTFFIPYALCLIAETAVLVRHLNRF